MPKLIGRRRSAGQGKGASGEEERSVGEGNAVEPRPVDFAQVGEQVATVLEAATAAAEKLRMEADAYANETRDAADVKASAILARAEKEAAAQERTFHDLRRSLDDGVVRTEERLNQLIVGLRELATGLEGLVARGSHENGNGDNGTLAEMLAAYSAASAPTSEGGTS
jgi:hypothetical protein